MYVDRPEAARTVSESLSNPAVVPAAASEQVVVSTRSASIQPFAAELGPLSTLTVIWELLSSSPLPALLVTTKSIPTLTRPTADTEMEVSVARNAALEGADPNIPNPKAATVASAMRLNVVFVDIYFLSEVVNETFSFTAGKEKLFAS